MFHKHDLNLFIACSCALFDVSLLSTPCCCCCDVCEFENPPPGPPGPVTSIIVTKVTGEDILLLWELPSDGGSILTHIKVEGLRSSM